jgi:hypothetical protein
MRGGNDERSLVRRRSIVLAATAGTLALGGGAIAVANGGGPFWGDPKEGEAEFARDLASKLDGVSAGEVRGALREVREEHHAEHRREMAAGLAAELDVSRADVEAALEKVERQFERRFEEGRPPRPRAFLGTLAEELGKTRSEVRKAFEAAARKRFEAGLDRAVEEGRLSEEEADRIRERFREGRPGFPGGFRRRGFVKPGGPHGPGGPDGPGGGFAIPVPPPR